jgi:hypothetical protein
MHSLRRYQISGFLVIFIIDYFQLISLYSAVEYLQFGTMEFQTANPVTIVRQARWMVENMDHESQRYYLGVPLFGALALLLTNICGDKEGTAYPRFVSKAHDRIDGSTKLGP